MALQFSTIGFINFNKEYNKVLKSGAITVSFTTGVKNTDGEYENQYFSGLLPAKLVEKAKPSLNKELVKIPGVISPTQKGYVNFTILEIEQYQKQAKSDNTDIDLPF